MQKFSPGQKIIYQLLKAVVAKQYKSDSFCQAGKKVTFHMAPLETSLPKEYISPTNNHDMGLGPRLNAATNVRTQRSGIQSEWVSDGSQTVILSR